MTYYQNISNSPKNKFEENSSNPLVSIDCRTYNHENFICETIDGFLMQKTTFPFEILIHDDASTDNTSNIIREYEKNYPDLIKPIYQIKNQYSINKRIITKIQNERAKGTYIAKCEGDDYWTDPYKLQKQVDFLEKNPEFSMCCTNFSVIDDKGNLIKETGWDKKKQNPEITHLQMLEYYTPKTLTSVIRKKALPVEFPSEKTKFVNGDTFLFSYVSQFGPAKFLNINTGCYRVNKGGVWSMKSGMKQNEMKYNTFIQLKKYYTKPEEQKAINARLSRSHIIYSKHLLTKGDIIGFVQNLIKSIQLSRKPWIDYLLNNKFYQ